MHIIRSKRYSLIKQLTQVSHAYIKSLKLDSLQCMVVQSRGSVRAWHFCMKRADLNTIRFLNGLENSCNLSATKKQSSV